MRVFVTGIAGFLGAHIAREGIACGWEVAGVDSLLGGDVSNVPAGANWVQADCVNVFEYEHLLQDVDVVYHCAAAPYEGLSVFSPQLVFHNTLMSTVAVLRAAINAKVKRFIFCSSMSRYGDQEAPFTEDMPTKPMDPYAVAKVASEEVVRILCDLHGVEWVVAVPHNIYGPGQRYYDPFRNVAGIMINRVLLGKSPIIYGTGQQVRSLSYIEDVTGPLLQLATADVAGEIFNLGPDAEEDEVTIEVLADLIRFTLGCSPGDRESIFMPARPAEVFEAHCGAAKARRVLGYKPRWALGDGLVAYAEWVKVMGAREFEYHLPLEIVNDSTPRTWSERLM
jgi:UDP-glucose 4-epimerase